MAASDTILGRVANREAFNKCAAVKRARPHRWRWLHFTVSAYTVLPDKRYRYTDPVSNARPRQSTVVYRIRVHPKAGKVITNLEPMA